MTGLVLELQKDALDPSLDVAHLLRKALVVSKKLGIKEIIDWINLEMNGYQGDDKIPEYREVRGEVKVFNPCHGLQPLIIADVEIAEALSISAIGQPITELCAIAKNDTMNYLSIPFSHAIKNDLIRLMNVQMEPTLVADKATLFGILEAVRNKVLDWALDLESKGVIGTGMSFSHDEKEVATQVTYQITNNIGSMQNSQFQQDSAYATQIQNNETDLESLAQLVEKLNSSISDINLSEIDQNELTAEINTLKFQLNSPKPKSLIIKESLKSSRNILEGVAGSLLATELISSISSFI